MPNYDQNFIDIRKNNHGTFSIIKILPAYELSLLQTIMYSIFIIEPEIF
jgi:Ribonuclease G/E